MHARRDLLRTGAAVGVGALTGLAGCIGDADSYDVASRIVDPFYLPGRPDEADVVTISPSAFDEYADQLPREDENRIRERTLDRFGFTRFRLDDLDWVTTVDGGYTGNGYDVVAGEFEGEAIEDDLHREGLRRRREYEGFVLYDADEWGAGVTDGELVAAGGKYEESPLRLVEHVIDTIEGEVRAYPDQDDDFGTLYDAVTPADFVHVAFHEPPTATTAEFGRFENHLGTAQSIELADDSAQVSVSLLFVSDRDIDEPAVETWMSEDETLRRWRDTDVEADERLISVSGALGMRDVIGVTQPLAASLPDDPVAVAELYWVAWSREDRQLFMALFHSESPLRDSAWWEEVTDPEEEFGPDEGIEWTIEERELVDKDEDVAFVREQYEYYDPGFGETDDQAGELHDRYIDLIELRREDGEWVIWDFELEDWESIDD